ncbi:MAG: hypothetical protein RLZ12_253 [Bacillota bacterium]|jgi:hypothetical protein
MHNLTPRQLTSYLGPEYYIGYGYRPVLYDYGNPYLWASAVKASSSEEQEVLQLEEKAQQCKAQFTELQMQFKMLGSKYKQVLGL